jgi:hypothetical protein
MTYRYRVYATYDKVTHRVSVGQHPVRPQFGRDDSGHTDQPLPANFTVGVAPNSSLLIGSLFLLEGFQVFGFLGFWVFGS